MIRSSGWDILNKYYHDTLPPHFGTSKTKTSTKNRQYFKRDRICKITIHVQKTSQASGNSRCLVLDLFSQIGPIRQVTDCNGTRTLNHLVRKRTLNHLAKLAS